MIVKEDIVSVIGSLNYDIILKQERLPKMGETLTADSITFSAGGKGANQAVQASKLGVRTYMIGAVGKDVFGDYLISSLEKFSVNTDFIKKVDVNTGMGIVNSFNDGKLISTISKGANFSITKGDIDAAKKIIAKSKIIIIQLEIPIDIIEYTCEIASENGCYIILNAAPAKKISDKILEKVNCLVVNEPEASFYSGEEIYDYDSAVKHCDKLFKKIKDLLIITLGENGSILYDGKNIIYVPANKVEVVETTGAGDSYIGAFTSKFISGAGIQEAAKFAALVSSITVMGIGGQDSMPAIGQIDTLNI